MSVGRAPGTTSTPIAYKLLREGAFWGTAPPNRAPARGSQGGVGSGEEMKVRGTVEEGRTARKQRHQPGIEPSRR